MRQALETQLPTRDGFGLYPSHFVSVLDIYGGFTGRFVTAETLKMCKLLGNRATDGTPCSAYWSEVRYVS